MSLETEEPPARVLKAAWAIDVARAPAVGSVDDARSLDYIAASDERLVGLLSVRDVKALETLYDRYGDYVYSVSLRVVGDVQLAEDIAQEVFLRLWRRPDLFDSGRGRFVTWPPKQRFTSIANGDFDIHGLASVGINCDIRYANFWKAHTRHDQVIGSRC